MSLPHWQIVSLSKAPEGSRSRGQIRTARLKPDVVEVSLLPVERDKSTLVLKDPDLSMRS